MPDETDGSTRVEEAAGPEAVVAQEVRYPDPPEELNRFGLAQAFKYFGPGAIVASITIGSGETVFASRGGAVFGYAILWTLVLGGLLKAAMIYSQNRYITVTGEHPMARWATVFPGPRGWFPLLMGIVSIGSFPFWAGGLSTFLGDYLSGLLFGNPSVWAIGLLVVLGAIAFAGGYFVMELAQRILVAAMLVAVLVAVFVARPDWLEALLGLVPNIPQYEGWLRREEPEVFDRPIWVEVVVYIGAIGGGTYDYIGYTGMLREKKWGMLAHSDPHAGTDPFTAVEGRELPLPNDEGEVQKARAWTRAPLGDVFISFAAITLFTVVFAINGANILHEQRLVPAGEEALTHQVEFFEVIDPTMEYLYYFAIVAAFTGTLYGLWEVYSYTAFETLSALSTRVRRAGVDAVRKFVYPYVFLGGLLLILTGWDPVKIVTWAAILGGTLTIGLFALAILYTERKVLPAPYRLRRFAFWYVLVAGVVLTAFGVFSVLQGLGIIPSV